MKKNKKVFLGGTCGSSTWREEFIPMLTISYFNPQLPEGAWNEDAQQQEMFHRENDDFVLYVITPQMSGVYSIAEVVDDSNKRPEKTVFVVLFEANAATFDKHQTKSLLAVMNLVEKNGAKVFASLEEAADYVNGWQDSE